MKAKYINVRRNGNGVIIIFIFQLHIIMKMHTYIIEDLNRFILFIKIKLLSIKLSCQNK
jgi:hypothetical protein